MRVNDFVVCKHYSGTYLLAEDVSYGFVKKYNCMFQRGTTLFNRSTENMSHFYVILHKVYIFKQIW